MEVAEQAQRSGICISLKAGAWSPVAEKWLSRAGDGYVDEYYRQYMRGARLLYVMVGDRVCGAVLMRIDIMQGHAEGVVVAASANVRGVDLTAQVLPAVESMFRGVDYVRIHTARAGLVKKLAKSGYEVQETVMRKKVGSCIYH